MSCCAPAPDVSIVICTCARPAQLERLLKSIQRQEATLAYEIIVVDNKPEQDAIAGLKLRFENVRWAIEQKLGLSFARNTGVRLARAPVIVFADDDIEVPVHWLQSLASPIRDDGYDLVTGTTLPLKLETEAERLFEAYGGHGHVSQRLLYDRSWLEARRWSLPLWQAGGLGNAAIRQSAFSDSKVGPLEEALGVGTPAGSWEDLYQFYKLLRANYRILHEPAASVRHAHRETLTDLTRQLCDYRRGEVCFCLLVLFRHRDIRGLFHLVCWIPVWRLNLFGQEILRRVRGERVFSFKIMWRELLAYASGPMALLVSLRNRTGAGSFR
jgi:glycosyltransferase involved in cell wall biosynthesis